MGIAFLSFCPFVLLVFISFFVFFVFSFLFCLCFFSFSSFVSCLFLSFLFSLSLFCLYLYFLLMFFVRLLYSIHLCDTLAIRRIWRYGPVKSKKGTKEKIPSRTRIPRNSDLLLEKQNPTPLIQNEAEKGKLEIPLGDDQRIRKPKLNPRHRLHL